MYVRVSTQIVAKAKLKPRRVVEDSDGRARDTNAVMKDTSSFKIVNRHFQVYGTDLVIL
jgi:hypothetical protein